MATKKKKPEGCRFADSCIPAMNLDKKFDDAIKRLEGKVDGVATSLNEIEINGDGKKRSLEDSLRYLASLMADKIERAKTMRKWEDRVFAIVEWIMKTKPRRKIAFVVIFVGSVYGVTSVLEDAGIIHQNAWKLTVTIASHFGS